MGHKHNLEITCPCTVALQTIITTWHLALFRVRLVRTKGATIRANRPLTVLAQTPFGFPSGGTRGPLQTRSACPVPPSLAEGQPGWVGCGVRGLWGVETRLSGAWAPRRRSGARLSGTTHLLLSRISPACRLLRVPGPPPAPPEEEENRDQHALGGACPGPRGGGAGARSAGGCWWGWGGDGLRSPAERCGLAQRCATGRRGWGGRADGAEHATRRSPGPASASGRGLTCTPPEWNGLHPLPATLVRTGRESAWEENPGGARGWRARERPRRPPAAAALLPARAVSGH